MKSSDLGKNAVTTGKVKNGSLLSADFKPGQLVAGAPGPAGPGGPKGGTGTAGATGLQGPKGDTGTNGTNGTPGVSGYERVFAGPFINNPNTQASQTVTCPVGKSVLGGGATSGDGSTAHSINSSFPASDTTWQVRMNNSSPNQKVFVVYAVCGIVQ